MYKNPGPFYAHLCIVIFGLNKLKKYSDEKKKTWE